MKTVILEKPGLLRFAATEPPEEPAPGEALVRVGRVGVCGTDLHAFRGEQPFFSYPRILGHELGVEVVAINPTDQNTGLSVGDRCAVEPYLNCGRCGACRRGRTNCCEGMEVIGVHRDGGMREFITIPASKLHRSNTLSLDQLALVETLCIGAHAAGRANLDRDEPVLVIGAGPIGLSVIEAARLAGAKVAVMEVSRSRLDFCRDRLGIELLIDGRDDPESQLREIFSGDLPTAVFDATGSGGSMARSFEYVAHGGRLVFVGLYNGEVTFHDPHFHGREISLLASRNATREDFEKVIGALEAGEIDLEPWVTHRASPEETPDEFPKWLDPASNTIKAMIQF